MEFGMNYVIEHKVGTEADYPYRGRDMKCKRKETGDRFAATKYVTIDPIDVNGLSAALEVNPISVAIEVRRDF